MTVLATTSSNLPEEDAPLRNMQETWKEQKGPETKTNYTGTGQQQFVRPTDRSQEQLCWRGPAANLLLCYVMLFDTYHKPSLLE
jgi:hypothetical protein